MDIFFLNYLKHQYWGRFYENWPRIKSNHAEVGQM